MRDVSPQNRRMAFGWVRAALIMLAVTSTPLRAADGDATSPATCSLQPGPARTVTRIIDGETLALDDGSEVRLAGAMAPRARDADAEPGAWPLEEAAKTSLAELTLGKRVELAYGATHQDRYGRHLAHLFLTEGGQRLWVQGEMLQLGLARAYALPGDSTCLSELIANEAIGRTAGAAVWASPLYAERPAEKSFLLASLRNTYQIVRGRIVSVTRTKGAVYLDFGEDWHTDFTVSIGKRVLSLDKDFDAGLEALKGKTIEVRGWIERRNGPAIVLSSPHELKVLDGEGETIEPPPVAQAPDDAPSGTVSAPSTEHTPPRSAYRHKQNRPKRKAPGDVDL